MEQLNKILEQTGSTDYISDDEYIKLKRNGINDERGKLIGYNCVKCLNKGYTAVIEENSITLKTCECMKIRASNYNLEKSGLQDLTRRYTFDTYLPNESWQKVILMQAMRYLDDYNGKWFFIGGQVGSGKTHICTAITGEFIKRGKSAKYMLWRDEIVKIKAVVNDDSEYGKLINALKQTDVLYIDDFYKVRQGSNPTDADVNVAFEILNYRYNNPSLITVISSEKTLDYILKIDEAIGSRIYERTIGYCVNLKSDVNKNFRMKNTFTDYEQTGEYDIEEIERKALEKRLGKKAST